LSAELFELALGKKSSLYISKEEALNYCKKLLEESSDDSNIQTYEEINIFDSLLTPVMTGNILIKDANPDRVPPIIDNTNKENYFIKKFFAKQFENLAND
jgi:hypothetical protein